MIAKRSSGYPSMPEVDNGDGGYSSGGHRFGNSGQHWQSEGELSIVAHVESYCTGIA